MFKINQPHMPDFTKPLDLLVHCHQRIEAQLNALELAAEILPAAGPQSLAELFATIDAACKHFAIAGVKHTEDEDVSLFPRLRERGGSGGEDALAAMAELESQHRRAEQFHKELDQLVITLPRDGSAEKNQLDQLSAVVAELTTLYRPHIMLENNFVFPIAGRVLREDDIQALGAEMRERRRDILQATAAVRC